MTDENRARPTDPGRDAAFLDSDPGPLALRALTAEEVPVISALTQDAVLTAGDLRYDRRARQFALLLNRFRWEDADTARDEGREFERVRALLVISDVLGVRTDGIDRSDAQTVLSLLALDWTPAQDGTGTLTLAFAGDGALALDCEALTLDLRDVTRPHRAVSGKMPAHDLD